MNTFDAAATYWRYHSFKIFLLLAVIYGRLELGLCHLSNILDRIVQCDQISSCNGSDCYWINMVICYVCLLLVRQRIAMD
jgi:hypothetical protein